MGLACFFIDVQRPPRGRGEMVLRGNNHVLVLFWASFEHRLHKNMSVRRNVSVMSPVDF